MQKRVCPKCGTVWYSADSRGVWICAYCHAEIPAPDTGDPDQPDTDRDNGTERRAAPNRKQWQLNA